MGFGALGRLQYRDCVSATALVAALLSVRALPAESLHQRYYRNRKLGLEFVLQEGWVVSRQTGYPQILAIILHEASDTTISLAMGARPVRAGDKPQLSQENIRLLLQRRQSEDARALTKVGLRVADKRADRRFGNPAIAQQLSAQRKPELFLYQLYTYWRGRALIWTLRCRASAKDAMLVALERVLSSVRRQKGL